MGYAPAGLDALAGDDSAPVKLDPVSPNINPVKL